MFCLLQFCSCSCLFFSGGTITLRTSDSTPHMIGPSFANAVGMLVIKQLQTCRFPQNRYLLAPIRFALQESRGCPQDDGRRRRPTRRNRQARTLPRPFAKKDTISVSFRKRLPRLVPSQSYRNALEVCWSRSLI